MFIKPISLIFIAVFMSEASKRSLRARRPPQHFNDVSYDKTQGEETEGLGYARMGTHKVPTTYIQDYYSPAQELNGIAKLFSKFINSVNKRINLRIQI